jgi:lipid-A-disaccharide synthase-like uncharacterized protein
MMPEWSVHTIWIGIGFLGQGLFFMRFFVQWLASEKQGRSVIPTAFWYFSLLGGMTLFCYAIWRRDPVFIIGQGTGLFIYLRNLYLLHKEKRDKLLGVAGQNVEESDTYSI